MGGTVHKEGEFFRAFVVRATRPSCLEEYHLKRRPFGIYSCTHLFPDSQLITKIALPLAKRITYNMYC